MTLYKFCLKMILTYLRINLKTISVNLSPVLQLQRDLALGFSQVITVCRNFVSDVNWGR